MYLNKVYLIGNLTKDPELKSLPTGTKVTSFGVATNSSYKDASGNKKEQTEYHNVVVFGRQAENSAQYLKKGQSVLIEGRIQTRSWDDKNDGSKKYRTEIIADSVQFGPKAGGASMTGSNPNISAPTENSKSASSNDMDVIDYGDVVDPDDIPF